LRNRTACFPQSRVEFRDALNGRFRGLRAANDLDQRDEVRRIEGMGDDAALRMGRGALLDFAHGKPRRARCDNHVGRQQLVELPIELLLEIDPRGPVLLDKVDADDRLRERGRELQVRLRRSGREAQSLERRPGGFHELPQRGFRVRRDVRRDDLQSLGEKQRDPARADDAGADNGDAANGLGIGHVISPFARLRHRRCR